MKRRRRPTAHAQGGAARLHDRRYASAVGFPRRKVARHLPQVLTSQEVERLLGALRSPLHRAVLMVAYGAGLRISEACSLTVVDIDSGAGVIHVRGGERRRDRDVMLGAALLAGLRAYWRCRRPSHHAAHHASQLRDPHARQATHLRTLQVVLGHGSAVSTTRYVHVSTARLRGLESPLERLRLPPPPQPRPARPPKA